MAIIRTLDLRGKAPFEAEVNVLMPRAVNDLSSALEVAGSVIEAVRARGAEAIREISLRVDGFDTGPLRVSEQELANALGSLDPKLRSAIELAISRVRLVSEASHPKNFSTVVASGATVSQRYVPVDSVGLYAPGGKAVYPSSVIMNAVPAQVAKVERIILATPGQSEFAGRPHPSVLATAALLGIKEVLCIGGPAAVAAMAYGLPEINLQPVRLITGPGNAYVAAAKRLVRSEVAIDSEAGTTEICIIADGSANAVLVAADLISQAEHDEAAACVLITDSNDLLESVAIELEAQCATAKHGIRIREALGGQQSVLVLVDSILEAARISNSYATEHLELLVAEPEKTLSLITNAGAIFLGEHSPVSLGDYMAGSNHVLPTGGTAKFSSGLGVHTFLRVQQVIDYSREGLLELSEALPTFARAEDLPAHGVAVTKRFEGQ